MKRNGNENKDSPEMVSGKRFKSDYNPSQPATGTRSYEDLNKKYTIAGFNQYTLQYLKRMSNSGKSNPLFNISSWISSFRLILCLALRVQVATYE